MQSRLDLLGMLGLAFVTALGGGIVRDLLKGDVPPSSIRDWHYAAVAAVLHAYTPGINCWLVITLDGRRPQLFCRRGSDQGAGV